METIMSAEFAVALCAARTQMGGVVKSKKNPAFGGSRYADLADILDEVTEPLHEAGISLFMPLVNSEDGRSVGVYIQMVYKNGEQYKTDPFFIPISKPDAQGFIAASTYARRCFATSYFCLPTEDDDGNVASGTKVPPVQARPPVAPPKPPPSPVVNGKPDLKVVTAEKPTEEMASDSAVDIYLKKWTESYPEGKDNAGNIIGVPSKVELLKKTKAALLNGYKTLPAVVEAEKLKASK